MSDPVKFTIAELTEEAENLGELDVEVLETMEELGINLARLDQGYPNIMFAVLAWLRMRRAEPGLSWADAKPRIRISS
jgi:hypothetical protein